MASKKDKDSTKSTNSNSKKRDRPEAKEWQWEDTELANEETTTMLAQDVKQLLLTRGEKKQNLKGKKVDIIKYLKEKYDVDLEEPLTDLTVKELQAELRLRKLDDTQAKKDILIMRLKGEIDATVPPPKRLKRGGKKTKANTQMFVVIYTPEDSGEDAANPMALGVFKSKIRAHEKAVDKLLEDMEGKFGAKKAKKIKDWKDKVDEEKDIEQQLEVAHKACEEAWGSPDESPYVVVSPSSVE